MLWRVLGDWGKVWRDSLSNEFVDLNLPEVSVVP